MRICVCSKVTGASNLGGGEELQERELYRMSSWHHDYEELNINLSLWYMFCKYCFMLSLRKIIGDQVFLRVFRWRNRGSKSAYRLKLWWSPMCHEVRSDGTMCQTWESMTEASGKGRHHNIWWWACWTLGPCLIQVSQSLMCTQKAGHFAKMQLWIH